jgi:hypothetical protein
VRVSFNLVSYFRVFLEDVLQKEFLCKSEAFDWHHTHVNEFTPHVVDDEVITDNEHLGKLFNRSELVLSVYFRFKEVSNLNKSLQAEIHLWNLVFFIINNFIIRVNFGVEISW